MTTGTMILLGGGLALACWVLAKVAHHAARVLETLAAIAALFVTLWLVVKGLYVAVAWLVRHWRTSLAGAGTGA